MSWEWLCTPPHPVTLDRAALAGLSNRPLPLDEVRVRLLDRACPGPVRDAVWAHLIERSRLDGDTWTVACAGMALPMLAAVCRTLCGGRGVERDDVASGIVTGFLTALALVDLDRAGLASALRWAAVRGGHTVLREQRRAPLPLSHDWLVRVVLTPTAVLTHTGEATDPTSGGDLDADNAGAERGHGLAPVGRWESAPPPTGGGHPDLVLAAAVDDGVLTRAEAALIGETRFEATTLAQAAARRGRTVGAVTMQRLRAEMRLVDHLRSSYYSDTAANLDGSTADGGGEMGRSVTAHGRGRQRRHGRPRPVTGHRSRAAGTQAPRCGHEQSPSVSTSRTTSTTGTARTTGTTRRRQGGAEGGGDGRVTR